MEVQTILTATGERLIVLAEADYLSLVEAAEDAADGRAVTNFRLKLATGEEELVASEIADRLLSGENSIKVWREYRGLTSKAQAERAGLAEDVLSQIETGERQATIDILARIATELRVSFDDLDPT